MVGIWEYTFWAARTEVNLPLYHKEGTQEYREFYFRSPNISVVNQGRCHSDMCFPEFRVSPHTYH